MLKRADWPLPGPISYSRTWGFPLRHCPKAPPLAAAAAEPRVAVNASVPHAAQYFTEYLCHIYVPADVPPKGKTGAATVEEQFVEPSNAPTQQTLGSPQASLGNSDWWQELRMRIIEFGIHMLWGKSAFPPPWRRTFR